MNPNYPPKPNEPLPSDCCGMGCRTCVFDLYEEELKLWQNRCLASESNVDDRSDCMSPFSYTLCILEKVEKYCHSVFLFRFSLPANSCLTFTAAQHLIAMEELKGEVITRPYTLASQPGTVTEFDVIVKMYPNGRMSQIIKEKWHPGYMVRWRGPSGEHSYTANRYRQIYLIAAGTGIIPLYQMANMIVNNEDDETRISLINCSRTYEDIIFRNEIQQLQSFWNFKARHFLSCDNEQEVESRRKHNEVIRCCKLTNDTLRKEIFIVSEIGFYICGPREFDKDIISYLTSFGIDPSRIFTF